MTERPTEGIFECPIPDCETVIIGSYTDLFTHVRGHPYSSVIQREKCGLTIVEEVREARSDALKKYARSMFVSGDPPGTNDQSTSDPDPEASQ